MKYEQQTIQLMLFNLSESHTNSKLRDGGEEIFNAHIIC